MADTEPENVFTVDGIVSRRDQLPYLRLFAGAQQVGQLSMAAARNVAMDILQMCSRTEADAMIYKFFDKRNFPEGAAAAILVDFRDFRVALDAEPVETFKTDPDTGEVV